MLFKLAWFKLCSRSTFCQGKHTIKVNRDCSVRYFLSFRDRFDFHHKNTNIVYSSFNVHSLRANTRLPPINSIRNVTGLQHFECVFLGAINKTDLLTESDPLKQGNETLFFY